MPTCCCIKTLNLCNVPVCGVLELDVTATAPESPDANNYKLVLDFLQSEITVTEEQAEGENIKFDVGLLNESYEYTGKIYDSSGNLVTMEIDGIEYDCIKFRTKMAISI